MRTLRRCVHCGRFPRPPARRALPRDLRRLPLERMIPRGGRGAQKTARRFGSKTFRVWHAEEVVAKCDDAMAVFEVRRPTSLPARAPHKTLAPRFRLSHSRLAGAGERGGVRARACRGRGRRGGELRGGARRVLARLLRRADASGLWHRPRAGSRVHEEAHRGGDSAGGEAVYAQRPAAAGPPTKLRCHLRASPGYSEQSVAGRGGCKQGRNVTGSAPGPAALLHASFAHATRTHATQATRRCSWPGCCACASLAFSQRRPCPGRPRPPRTSIKLLWTVGDTFSGTGEHIESGWGVAFSHAHHIAWVSRLQSHSPPSVGLRVGGFPGVNTGEMGRLDELYSPARHQSARTE